MVEKIVVSCVSLSVDDHFKNRPVELRKIFDYILQELKKNDPVRVDLVKSGINLAKDMFRKEKLN